MKSLLVGNHMEEASRSQEHFSVLNKQMSPSKSTVNGNRSALCHRRSCTAPTPLVLSTLVLALSSQAVKESSPQTLGFPVRTHPRPYPLLLFAFDQTLTLMDICAGNPSVGQSLIPSSPDDSSSDERNTVQTSPSFCGSCLAHSVSGNSTIQRG